VATTHHPLAIGGQERIYLLNPWPTISNRKLAVGRPWNCGINREPRNRPLGS
jgi:hypothetical protein